MSAPNGTATTGLQSILQDAASCASVLSSLQKLLNDLCLEGCSILLSHTARPVLSKASLRANFLSPVWS